jgi:hypothetical protein
VLHGAKLPLGTPTRDENALINGELAGKVDPFRLDAMLGDSEKPAEQVLQDSQGNNFLQKEQGEPISVCGDKWMSENPARQLTVCQCW